MTSSPPSRRYWDRAKTHSFWAGGTPRPEDLPHVVSLAPASDGMPAVPYEHADWCRNNCRHPWAWWFDEDHAYMGFADVDECLLYSLSNQ